MARYQSAYATMAAPAPASRKGLLDWIGRYWFQLFLIFLALHIFLRKDISVQVNMKSLGSALESGYDDNAGGMVRAVPASLSLGDQLFSKGEPDQGRAFYYLLNPKAAKKDRVPREVLVSELEKSRKLVERFARVALAERSKFNIPASILLAQAILCSHNGESPYVKKGNNYFALPAKSGEYRAFHSAWESFREHSKRMRAGEFDSLQRIPLTDYKAWASGLEDAGFSPERGYARNLIRIVELLDLDQFDRA
ncbi:MAG: glucosaminidase domain-containing protein [Saprospiraceae bacterium]